MSKKLYCMWGNKRWSLVSRVGWENWGKMSRRGEVMTKPGSTGVRIPWTIKGQRLTYLQIQFFWLQSLTFSNQQICLAGQIGWLHDSVQNLNFWCMKKISWTLTDPKCKKRRQRQFLRNVSMGKIIRQEQEGAIARTFGQCQQLGNDGNY